jgi:hypothetical protein
MARQKSLVDDYFSTIFELGLVNSKVNARRHLEDLFDGIEIEGKRMLDIGGGSGIYSYYAGSMGGREVVCLEPEAAGSHSGVTGTFEKIRSRLPEAKVTLDTRTVQEYPTDGEKFDIIFSHASINHLDEDACVTLLEDSDSWNSYKSIFTLVGGLANKGARLIVVDCTRFSFFAFFGVKNPLCPTIEWFKHQKPEVWARLLEEAGFKNPSIRWEPIYRFGKPGKLLLGNAAAAYFLKSIFRLEMEKA